MRGQFWIALPPIPFQTKDLRARKVLGGFIPSCGVGTGFRRDALEKLALAHINRIFEPECLTEDYENGFRMHRLGCTQFVIPIFKTGNSFLATREYFPRKLRGAVRQRTRWIMGNALQSWQRHGWRDTQGQFYWRSEERRVGKGGRDGSSRGHENTEVERRSA